MPTLVDRYLRAGDLIPGDTWRLAEWCRQHGAMEFTVAAMCVGGTGAPLLVELERALERFRRHAAPRGLMVVLAGQPSMQPVPLWTLTAESLDVLRRFLPGGLFEYPGGDWERGWLEDPTFYRDGQVMLGVASHEGEGVLRLTAREHAAVAAAGFRTHIAPVVL